MPEANHPGHYAVIIFGNTPKPAVLDAYNDLDAAECARSKWLACYARRPDRPAAATYRRVDADSDADLLAVLRELTAGIADRRARVHIQCAIQEAEDWRYGKDAF